MNGLIVDLFAGGGGASTGLAWALGRANGPETWAKTHCARPALPLLTACLPGVRRGVFQPQLASQVPPHA